MEYDFKILENDRIKLRKITLNDVNEIYDNWASSSIVTKHLTWDRHESIEVTKKVIEKWEQDYKEGMNYRWGIVLKENNILVGMIDTVELDLENRIASLGFVLGEKYWNQNIMTEAVRLVIDYLFNSEGFLIIKASHNIDNKASGRVMEKASMKFEGMEKDGMRNSKNEIFDVIRYSINKKQWLSRNCDKKM